MSNNTIQIETRLLQAALHCAAKKDIRYFLNAVLLEVRDTTVTALGTDGTILFAGQVDIVPYGESRDVLIPRETVEAILKGYKEPSIELECNVEGDQHRLGNSLFTEVDVKFPEWRKVVPENISKEPANYDPRVLTQAHKALAVWDGQTPASFNRFYLHQNGPKAAVAQIVGGDDRAFCLIMPRRSKHEISIGWARK